MTTREIYVKTDAGVAELRTRAANLPWRLRTLLLLVDGTKDLKQLEESVRMVGAPPDAVEQLVTLGMIATQAASARPASAAAAVASAAPSRPASGSSADVATAPAATAAAVEPRTEAQAFRDAQKFMNDTVVDALGIRALFFTLKLEKCASRADLRSLMPDYLKILGKAHHENVVKLIESEARAKLA